MNQLLFYMIIGSSLSSLDHRPRLCDADVFPNAEVCQENIRFNELYHYQLTHQQSLYMQIDPRWQVYQDAIKETEQLERVWQLLVSIQNNRKWSTGYSNQWSRDQLQKLREMLDNDDDFFNGRMPPPVPLWRFRELD